MTLHAISELLGIVALVLGIGAVLALAWILPHRGFHHLRGPAGRALRSPRLAGARRQAPAVVAFAERHAHDPRPSWLRLLLGALCFAGGVAWFIDLMRGVLHDGRLVTADHCLHATVATFDSAAMVRFYSAVTNLASTAFVAPLVVSLAAVFWLAGRRREGLGLLLALGGALALSAAFKLIIQRPRPPEAVALFRDSSFPSGHTLVGAAVYGFLAYLALRDEERRGWRWLVAVPLLLLIAAVPLSRVYLGMHWPYDTVGSLALAGAWLAVLIALFKYPPLADRLSPAAPGAPAGAAASAPSGAFTASATTAVSGPPAPSEASTAPAVSSPRPPEAARWLPGAVAGLAAALALYGAWLAAHRPQRKLAPLPAAVRTVPAAYVLAAFPAGLPTTSRDAVGGLMEPVSYVVVGDAGPILDAFARAGWQLAEPQSVHGLLRELWSVAANLPDPRGPATPVYFDGQPQDLTFEKPGDPSGSIRRRHHTRLWKTALCVAPRCTPLWVATASYDQGIKLIAEPYLFTHSVDPRVDLERELIARDLRQAGARVVNLVAVSTPSRGENASGDAYVTDGRAYVLLVGEPLTGAAAGPAAAAEPGAAAGSAAGAEPAVGVREPT